MKIIAKQIEDAWKLPIASSFRFGEKDYLEKSLIGQKTVPHKGGDVESVHYTDPPALNCIKNGLTLLLIFITILLGVFGGYFIYRSFRPNGNNPTEMHYHTVCEIPYESFKNVTKEARTYYATPENFLSNFHMTFPRIIKNPYPDARDGDAFREEIEMEIIESVEDGNEEGFAKIDVPDFKDGRHGRFMHDFKENQSAIIDSSANRCFIMPMDRSTTLPPKSFMDLMEKMSSGYYNIDTERVRRKMRVVLPPVSDLTLISERIANECYDMRVYMLENYISGVYKREAILLNEHGKFAEFSGKGIVEYDILNIADIENYESQHKK